MIFYSRLHPTGHPSVDGVHRNRDAPVLVSRFWGRRGVTPSICMAVLFARECLLTFPFRSYCSDTARPQYGPEPQRWCENSSHSIALNHRATKALAVAVFLGLLGVMWNDFTSICQQNLGSTQLADDIFRPLRTSHSIPSW